MADPGQDVIDALNELKRRRGMPEGAESPQSAAERFARGAYGGLTAPLHILGIDVDPGIEGPPGLAGAAGEFVGATIPYVATESLLAKTPLFAGSTVGRRAIRSAATFGALGTASRGEVDARAILADVITGGIIGAGTGPGVSVPKAALVGGAAALVPAMFGQDIGAPVEVTGNPKLDAVIFNSLVAGAFQFITPHEVKSSVPMSDEFVRAAPVKSDPGTPQPTASARAQTILDSVLGRDTSARPVAADPAIGEWRPPGMEPAVQPPRPIPPLAASQTGRPLTELPAIPTEPKPIEISRPRPVERAFDVPTKSKRQIPLPDETRRVFDAEIAVDPDAVPGYDGTTLNLEGLRPSQIRRIQRMALDIMDKDTTTALDASLRGMTGGRGRGFRTIEGEQVPGVETRNVAYKKQQIKTVRNMLDKASSADEAGILGEEAFNDPEIKTPKRWKGASLVDILPHRDPGEAKGGSYADMIKALRERNIVTVYDNGKYKLVMPDKSTKSMSFDEMRDFVKTSIPSSTVAPVFKGPDAMPGEAPITKVHATLDSPFGDRPSTEVRPLKVPEVAPELETPELEPPTQLMTESEFQKELHRKANVEGDNKYAGSLFRSAVYKPTKVGTWSNPKGEVPIFADTTLNIREVAGSRLPNRVMRTLNALPKSLTDGVRSIYLTYQPKAGIAGEAMDRRIALNVGITTDPARTFVHELVHTAEADRPGMFDELARRLGWRPIGTGQEAVAYEMSHPSAKTGHGRGQTFWVHDRPTDRNSYMYRNPIEHIAEAYTQFAKDPDKLRATDPKTYEAIATSEHLTPFFLKGFTAPEESGQYRLLYLPEKFDSPPPPPMAPETPKVIAVEQPELPFESAFLKALSSSRLLRTYESMKEEHRFDLVRGAADAKGIDLTIGEGTFVTSDPHTGEVVRHKSLRDAADYIGKSKTGVGKARGEEEFKSIFRRRFAASRSAVETTRIKEKYRKYAQFLDDSPPRAGEVLLRSIDHLIDAETRPVLDLVPGLPPVVPPGGQHPRPPFPGDRPPGWEGVDVDYVNTLGFGTWFRQTRNLFLDIEDRTKKLVPAFSKVWEPLFGKHEQMQSFLNNYRDMLLKSYRKINSSDDAAWFRVGRHMEQGDAAIKQYGIRDNEVAASRSLREFFNKLWGPEGFKFVDEEGKALKGVDFIQNYLPMVREHPDWDLQQVRNEFARRKLSTKPLDFFAEHPRLGDMMDNREMNAFKLAVRYLDRGSRKMFLSDELQKANDTIENLIMPKNLEWMRERMRLFVRHVQGYPDPQVARFNGAFRSVLRKMGVAVDEDTGQDLTALLMQMSVAAHIGWRPALVLRNFSQVSLMYPLLGASDFGFAMKSAMSKEWASKAMRAGVPLHESLPFYDEIYRPFGRFTDMVRKGTVAYGKVDDLTRVMGFAGMYNKIMREAQPLMQGKIGIKEFVRRTELTSVFHPVEAKFILDLLRAGDLEGAATKAGVFFQGNTNWIYSSVNRPEAFRGVAGRLFGQFGMWPASYVDYVKYLFKFGSGEERSNKILRFMAMNAAIGGLGAYVGVDLWKWVAFGPLAFTGGPYLQMAQDALKVGSAIASGQDDVESRLAKERLQRTAATTLIPGAGAFRDIQRTKEAYETGGGLEALRSLVSAQKPTPGPMFGEPSNDPLQRLRDMMK